MNTPANLLTLPPVSFSTPPAACPTTAHAPQHTGSAGKIGKVLVEELNKRRAEAGPAATGGVTVTAGEAGLV